MIAIPSSQPPLPTSTASPILSLCSTVLPAGTLSLGPGFEPITLSAAATLWTDCPTDTPTAHNDAALAPSISGWEDDGLAAQDHLLAARANFGDFRDPFSQTSSPVFYALAACTVTAYILLVMLFMTPPRFPDGDVVYLGRRGGFSSRSGAARLGERPWLQKVAALSVVISLTIASANTFKVAEDQYDWGVQNAGKLQADVLEGIELKAIRLVSDMFLWLAQAQTVLRLFPSPRTKNIIKFTAFALIILDFIFSSLNSFMLVDNGSQGSQKPKTFNEPVSTLSYLFQLALGIAYAACVLLYVFKKRRYAFYHPLVRNMVLVATIALTAVLIPIAFFIVDVSASVYIGWSDYVRWVGAAAASVLVWEWVDRIETLERQEKKDGILGREVFDGDNDAMYMGDGDLRPGYRKKTSRDHHRDDYGSGQRTGIWPAIATRYLGQHDGQGESGAPEQTTQRPLEGLLPQSWLARPAPAVVSPSRENSPSAVSTEYIVHYQSTETTSRTPDPLHHLGGLEPDRPDSTEQSQRTGPARRALVPEPTPSPPVRAPTAATATTSETQPRDEEANTAVERSRDPWRTLTNPLGRSGPSTTEPAEPSRPQPGRWDIRARVEVFAANQAERFRERMRPTPDISTLQRSVYAAPPRRGEVMAEVLNEEGIQYRASMGSSQSGDSRSSSSTDLRSEGRRSRDSQRSGEEPPPLWPGVENGDLYDDDTDGNSEYTTSTTFSRY